MIVAKPFRIPKRMVWEAYLRGKANGGGPGADGQSVEDFEVDLKDSLYRIWNRLSSGSYYFAAHAAMSYVRGPMTYSSALIVLYRKIALSRTARACPEASQTSLRAFSTER